MREDSIVTLNDNKGIELSGPISVIDIHRYLQDKAARPANFVSKMLGISYPNPSQSLTADIHRLLNGWYIEPDSIKWIHYGSWEDKNGIYNRLQILGGVPEAEYTIKTDGEVFKGARSQGMGAGPGYYIKKGTYFKVLGENTYKMKMEVTTMPYNYVAPATYGKSFSQILEEL